MCTPPLDEKMAGHNIGEHVWWELCLTTIIGKPISYIKMLSITDTIMSYSYVTVEGPHA